MKFTRSPQSGFSLVEVVFALGIAAFCLLNIVGVLLFGVQGAQTTGEQTAAVGLAMDVISDLRVTPLSTSSNPMPKSPHFNISMPLAQTPAPTPVPVTIYFDTGGNPGVVNATPGATAVYRLSVGITPPVTGQRTATQVRVMVTWPAMADANPANWPRNYRGRWETMINLDRN